MTGAKFIYLVLGIEFDGAKRKGGVKHRAQTAGGHQHASFSRRLFSETLLSLN